MFLFKITSSNDDSLIINMLNSASDSDMINSVPAESISNSVINNVPASRLPDACVRKIFLLLRSLNIVFHEVLYLYFFQCLIVVHNFIN